ncbi:Flagellar hook protein FlgE [compost metagenome]
MVLVNNVGDKVLSREENPIIVPKDSKVAIDDKGNVWAIPNGTTEREQVAQILVLELERPEGLVQIDGNKFVLANGVTANAAFGASAGTPPENVSIRSGYLEKSNVDLTIAMAEMVQIQRAYQLMSRALTSSDTMMNLANNLRG